MIILSVLICSLNKRRDSLKRLLDTLGYFIGVEVLVEVDDGAMTTGAKRNKLLQRAKGIYVVFIDDDDMVIPTYLQNIIEATRTEPDAIGFKGFISFNGGPYLEWKISKDLPYETLKVDGVATYLRYNNHLSPVKREIALQIGYPDKYFQEDYDYATALHRSGLIKTEVFIDKHLYFYNYKSHK